MNRKRCLQLIVILLVIFALAGCSTIDNPNYLTPESTGIWTKYVVWPLSRLIVFFAELFSNSYGLSIIVVTILLRFAILPLMIKQTKNSLAMQAIQPEMQKLREKYSSKDAVTQQKLQEEMMKLFQKYNVNPLAGCFPLLIQMPILIGFYQAIIRTKEIALNGNFLWLHLGNPDPYFILPVIAAVTTYLQQKLMMAGTENVNPQMKMMLYMMPAMILIFAISFPAALALYWVVGNIFMIIQTMFIKPPVAATPKTDGTTNKQGNTKQKSLNQKKVRGAKK